MAELSIIIPYCNEGFLPSFTLRSIYEELQGRVDFEIFMVDNSMGADDQECKGEMKPKMHNHFLAIQRGYKEIKALKYDGKLSHWQAKNMAVRESTGKFMWFCDAHCIIARDALFNMFTHYKENHEKLNGSLHLPLTYHIMEYHKLIYKLVGDIEKGEVGYSFSGYRDEKDPYQVPVMSTCGMMITRQMYDDFGGWPTELGIYGGGERFINFVLAVTGKTVNIMPGGALHHHGDKRGYSWNFDDKMRNELIATYCFGGEEMARKFALNHRPDPGSGHPQKTRILESVINNAECKKHRDIIKEKQVTSIQDWWCSWKGKG